MKLLHLIVIAAVIGCANVDRVTPWEHAGSGSCNDVDVNLRHDVPAACPHRDHQVPLETGRSTDGKFVGYRCFCWR